jgi:1,4-dihydroxy-2-naphthoate octaprenyltransferase
MMKASALPSIQAPAWALAARPKTLVCAIVPVLVGSAVAYREGGFRADVGFAALISAMLIQIGTNLANDVFDFEQGADTSERLGPVRAVASGLLPAASVKRAMRIAFLLAVLVGTYLVFRSGWAMVPLGLSSVAAGLGYTRGKRSLGYLGLGDAFVLVFFGLAAVAGTTFAESERLGLVELAAGLSIGALATVILVVNNVRDRRTDAVAEKRTLVVRFGVRFARAEMLSLFLIAYATPIALHATGHADASVLGTLATLPLAVWIARDLFVLDGRALNATLQKTAALLLAFGVLFAVGLAR